MILGLSQIIEKDYLIADDFILDADAFEAKKREEFSTSGEDEHPTCVIEVDVL